VSDVEKAFAFQLVILHVATGIDTGCLDFYREDSGFNMTRRELECGTPMVELAGKIDRGFDVKLDCACLRDDGILGKLTLAGCRQHGKQKAAE
jgi:hypothetical protein